MISWVKGYVLYAIVCLIALLILGDIFLIGVLRAVGIAPSKLASTKCLTGSRDIVGKHSKFYF